MSEVQTVSDTASHIPFAEHGSYPVREGNRVRPLVDGEPAFRRICEAIEAAQHSVWATIAFYNPDFRMPDGRGGLFDVLDRAVARGLDVRVIFWRNNDGSGFVDSEMFTGHAGHHEMLTRRGSRFLARWDRAQKRYCQHQKSWLIDAGKPGETAFVGGINLNPNSVVSPGHAHGEKSTHDVYAEVVGPSATDVHHNFVQRWNETSDRAAERGSWPLYDAAHDLPFPAVTSPKAGDAVVQIQRTVRAGHYSDGTATPGGEAFPIVDGERSVFEQYLKAIDAAKRTIYVEDQAIGSPEIVEKLDAACARGVEVVFLVPADANEEMVRARALPQSKPFFDRLGALGRHDNFTLAGIAAANESGVLRNIYVHAKIALIDDCWATIGSCNIGARSFFGDTELNASFCDPEAVKALRVALLREHLGIDTSHLDDRAALAEYRSLARANTARRAKGQPMTALAFALDPATYPG
jgi:phosphatidylserine/phosphatidylglycerophosphate/cardiolipin synthase-like enzyme